MEYDNEALAAKSKEVADFAARMAASVKNGQLEQATAVIDAFVRLTPPSEPKLVIEMITASSAGRGGGVSRKAGNIVLNWRRLIDVVPDATVAAAGATSASPWLLPLIALYVWNKLWRGAEEHLDEIEACVIVALWKNRNHDNKISEDDGFAHTNSLRRTYGLVELSQAEYVTATNRLLKIDCIEIDDGIIWLREWVRMTY